MSEPVEPVEVVVGRVGRPHGLRGDVSVEVRTDSPELRFVVGAHLRGEPGRDTPAPAARVADLEVVDARWHSGRLLLRFAGAEDRDSAEALRGTLLHTTLAPGETPEDPEEFYDHQLVGLAVHDLDGTVLGELVRVVHGGAQDLLEVRTPSGRRGLVPFVSALVPEVDLAAGRVVVADRPGLVTPFPDESAVEG
ncbi:ribosome maturation factor RimM [Nocardioides sp. CFH 31398]|uniref:ribosome maturation factor RimM n=1 Tax=Nocardioides sp. CFH 31398 TaxID=2919579 RepID=UPI001F0606EE|nr:ribosome maturation factor RimM [Nocardioides sp. CFH 31398]MCH1868671.1 ribosome maturation factor RimM [Nocardioides sp. CFH 31398]